MTFNSDRPIKDSSRNLRGSPSGRPQDFDDSYNKGSDYKASYSKGGYSEDASSKSQGNRTSQKHEIEESPSYTGGNNYQKQPQLNGYYQDSHYEKPTKSSSKDQNHQYGNDNERARYKSGYPEDKFVRNDDYNSNRSGYNGDYGSQRKDDSYGGNQRKDYNYKNNDGYSNPIKSSGNYGPKYGDDDYKPKDPYNDSSRYGYGDKNYNSYSNSSDKPTSHGYSNKSNRDEYNSRYNSYSHKDDYQRNSGHYNSYNKNDKYGDYSGSNFNNYNEDKHGKNRGYDNHGKNKVSENYGNSKGYDSYGTYDNGRNNNGYDSNRGKSNGYGGNGRSNHGYGDNGGNNRGYNDYDNNNSYGKNNSSNTYGRDGDSYHSNSNRQPDQGYGDRNRDNPRGGYNGYTNRNDGFGGHESQDRGRDRLYGNLEGNNSERSTYSQVKPKGGWASSRKRYEWVENSEVPVADLELEKELFGEENHVLSGINFKKYHDIEVKVMGKGPTPIESFDEAGLHPTILANIKFAKYVDPTPVQSHTIPITLDGLDLMACAQTGSGKTAAFLLPILSKLCYEPPKPRDPISSEMASSWGGYQRVQRGRVATPSALILAPTRELASQIFDECRRFAYKTKLRPCLLYGGASVGEQARELEGGCDILTATPGRLKDFITKNKVNLKNIRFVVIDEADRMLEMSFNEDIKIILGGECPSSDKRQTMLFSATFPKAVRQMAKEYMRRYLFLAVGRIGGTTSDIVQNIEQIEDRRKRDFLMNILLNREPCKTLIFVETKRGADTLDDFLYHKNLPCTSIHGERSQAEREDALTAFRKDQTPILIATAVAARGLDIKDVKHVINYDLPNTIDEYVHRIGRTARAGNKGTATSFFNQANAALAPGLIKLLRETKQEIPSFLLQYDYGNSGGTNLIDEDIGVPDEAEWNEIQTGYDNYKSEHNKQPVGWGSSSGPGNWSNKLNRGWDDKYSNPNPIDNGWGAPKKDFNTSTSISWDSNSRNDKPTWDNKSTSLNIGWDTKRDDRPTWDNKSTLNGIGWDTKPDDRPTWDKRPSSSTGVGWDNKPSDTNVSNHSEIGWNTKKDDKPSWDNRSTAPSTALSWDNKSNVNNNSSGIGWSVVKEDKPTWGVTEPKNDPNASLSNGSPTHKVAEPNSGWTGPKKEFDNSSGNGWGKTTNEDTKFRWSTTKPTDQHESDYETQNDKFDSDNQGNLNSNTSIDILLDHNENDLADKFNRISINKEDSTKNHIQERDPSPTKTE